MITLREEITAGPLAEEIAPFLADGNNAAIAALFHEDRFDGYGPISRARFAMWAGRTGLRAKIEDHAGDRGSPLRSIALLLLDFLRGGVAEDLDFGAADNVAMLGEWVKAGGITQKDADELLAMSLCKVSRAKQTGLTVTPETVAGSKP